ncbi:MAG TPA: TetR/AcrR family transcriptional regulator C-terminal domain-containing protein [Patescibacteria group bacterium]|nr:TetR/AcrR family transcriptional regulator C-terminal domain-containing protein [Patescibacteria group bacterium]
MVRQPLNKPDCPVHAPCLERGMVVDAALELLDEAGFDGLTLRRLAAKLGVKAAALYWHFKNKQDLTDQLAMAILDRGLKHNETPSNLDSLSWQELLQLAGRGMRNALLKYRDGSIIIAKADFSQGFKFKGRDIVITGLKKRGFTAEQAFMALFAVGRFTLGCVFEEQADPRTSEAIAACRANITESPQDYPDAIKIFGDIDYQRVLDPDYQYEQGLAIIIAGIGLEHADLGAK